MPKIETFDCWLEDGDTGERFEEYQTEVKDGKASTTVNDSRKKANPSLSMLCMAATTWHIAFPLGGLDF